MSPRPPRRSDRPASGALVVSGDLTADGVELVQHLLTLNSRVILASSDIATAGEIASSAAAAGIADNLHYVFVDGYAISTLEKVIAASGPAAAACSSWIHLVDAREVLALTPSDFRYGAEILSDVSAIVETLQRHSSSHQTRLVVHCQMPAGETPASRTLMAGLSAYAEDVRQQTQLGMHVVHLTPAPEHEVPGQASRASTFLATEDGNAVESAVLRVRVPATVATNDSDQFQSDTLQRVAQAGFARRDALPRYWQQRFQPPSPALAAVQQNTSNEGQRTVVITGASRGLGLEASREFARLGHRVIACARSPEGVKRLAAELGDGHHVAAVDIADDAGVAKWAQQAMAQMGPPDLILNNAAMTNAGKQTWRFTAEEFDQLMTVNVAGTMNVLRQFVPSLIKLRRGVIVNFSSAMGRMTSEKSGPYCTSKWAIEGLTGALNKELPPSIAAVTLHPGNIQTDAMSASFGEAASLYPTPAQWAQVAVPYLLQIGPSDGGRQLAVPGMTAFRGIGPLRRGTSFSFQESMQLSRSPLAAAGRNA